MPLFRPSIRDNNRKDKSNDSKLASSVRLAAGFFTPDAHADGADAPHGEEKGLELRRPISATQGGKGEIGRERVSE